MKPVKLLSIIGFLSLTLFACKKKEEPQPSISTSTTPLSFTELVSDRKAVPLGEQSTLTATATGTGLSYEWSTNTGATFIGSGYQVNFFAGCTFCLGSNVVTCRVSDESGNSETKTVPITVTE